MIKEFFKKLNIKAGLLHFICNDRMVVFCHASIPQAFRTSYKKVAFTLAEVLITLAIIGVVAALTLPTLNKKIKDLREMSRLKQTYSTISQAIKLSQIEYGEVGTWGIEGVEVEDAELIANKLKPYLKIAIDCGVTNDKKCIYDGKYKYLKEYNTNNATSSDYGRQNNYYKIVLQNGIAIWWRGGNSEVALIVVFIDLNGKKGPNCWGKDLFAFEYSEKSKAFVPFGHPNGTVPYTTSCTPNSTGYGCTYYALNVLKSLDLKF